MLVCISASSCMYVRVYLFTAYESVKVINVGCNVTVESNCRLSEAFIKSGCKYVKPNEAGFYFLFD